MDVLSISLSGNMREWMGMFTKVPLLSEDPIPLLSSGLKTMIRLRGKTFRVGIYQDMIYSSILKAEVKKCFFYDYFRRNGASYLTSLFCTAERKMVEVSDQNVDQYNFFASL
jgi:hypothetical protein